MRCLSLRNDGDCLGYAGSSREFASCSPGDLGTQRYARRIFFRQGEEQVGRPEYVVSSDSYRFELVVSATNEPVSITWALTCSFLRRLIYQLIEYERKLKGNLSPVSSERSSAIAEEEEEWGRRRKLLDEAEEGGKGACEEQQESKAVLAEAQALDRAMEERIIARRSSASSLASNSSLNGFGNGVGMGQAWRSRYATTRKRTGSIASNHTNYSILSEELVEEDEEQALLGVGGGFDDDRPRLSIASSTDSSNTSATSATSSADHSPDDESNPPARKTSMDDVFTPSTARPLSSRPAFPLPPPSAPPSDVHYTESDEAHKNAATTCASWTQYLASRAIVSDNYCCRRVGLRRRIISPGKSVILCRRTFRSLYF
ncbi:dual specificity catalytic domain containing protein [Salix suchowensis]|nr:dual specificity catalytic domain containing protein [Salix suchowensis]